MKEGGMKASRSVWLSLGANLGNRGETIREALRRIAAIPATRLVQVASFYETAPWGRLDQPGFINTAAEIVTALPLLTLLQKTQQIERALGRVRHEHWGARTIDIDLLAAENETSDTEALRLPHPYLTERAFVLRPLADIAPELLVRGRTVREWYAEPAVKGQKICPAAEFNMPWPLRMIAAAGADRGIGRDGQLLAHVPEDMARFKALTAGHIVIMGRRTQESLPGGRPLKDRINIVLTRQPVEIQDFIACHNIEELWQVLGKINQKYPEKKFWCIGGGEIYRQLLPYTSEIQLTLLKGSYPAADTFFPDTAGIFIGRPDALHCRKAAADGSAAEFLCLKRIHPVPPAFVNVRKKGSCNGNIS